jgi:hypothetical protein
MTPILRGCVAIACPYARRISCSVPSNTQLSGTLDLQFRTIGVMLGLSRHAVQSTANAVGSNGPPGFKSPILRSVQHFSLST